jgi:hypothetical protein
VTGPEFLDQVYYFIIKPCRRHSVFNSTILQILGDREAFRECWIRCNSIAQQFWAISRYSGIGVFRHTDNLCDWSRNSGPSLFILS